MNDKKITVKGLQNASGPGVTIRRGEVKPLPKDKAVMLLNAGFAEPVKEGVEAGVVDKESLVEKAVELGIGTQGTLIRWSVKKLSKAIAAAEAEKVEEDKGEGVSGKDSQDESEEDEGAEEGAESDPDAEMLEE